MSNTEALISFEDLNHLLVPLGALNSPAELHGMLCGKFCGGERLEADAWLLEALSFLDLITEDDGTLKGDQDGAAQTAIGRLYHVALAQLQDSDYSVQILLPRDDAELEDRTDALGQWCHGFLTGFGSSGVAGNTQFSEDCTDALRDITAIVSIGNGSDEEDQDIEGAENDFVGIVEYVRLAALTLFTDHGWTSAERAAIAAGQQEANDAQSGQPKAILH